MLNLVLISRITASQLQWACDIKEGDALVGSLSKPQQTFLSEMIFLEDNSLTIKAVLNQFQNR